MQVVFRTGSNVCICLLYVALKSHKNECTVHIVMLKYNTSNLRPSMVILFFLGHDPQNCTLYHINFKKTKHSGVKCLALRGKKFDHAIEYSCSCP